MNNTEYCSRCGRSMKSKSIDHVHYISNEDKLRRAAEAVAVNVSKRGLLARGRRKASL
jgi:hypothetical protein